MKRATTSRDTRDRWVLVADADQEAANQLARYFSQRGFSTYRAVRGEEALLLAHSRRLLLAIIDVSLLDMSGHALARRLKAIDPGLPLVMTSADYAPELEAAARRVGIIYYAHKPVDRKLIDGVVGKALPASLSGTCSALEEEGESSWLLGTKTS